MFLGLDLINSGIMHNVTPAKVSYDRVSIFGNCQVDSLVLHNEEKSNNVILEHFNDITPPSFYTDTVVVGNFENTLECGSLITGVGLPLNKYVVRRREIGSTLNPLLAELNYDQNLHTYIDYTPKNNIDYIYTVTPVFEDLLNRFEGRGVEGGSKVDFWGWILSDLAATPITQYKFDVEIESSDIEVVEDVKKYDNYTQYPTFRRGHRKYRELTLKTIPYSYNSITGEYNINVAVLEGLRDFINNGDVKLIRTTSGESFYCNSWGFSYR
jgi:hypothetical protein